MKVLYVTPDSGGCMLYRCALPARRLRDAGGHTVKMSPNYAVTKSGEILAGAEDDKGAFVPADHFDVVVLQRVMVDRTPDDIRRARATGQVVINDVDDWFWGLPQSNVAFFGTHPNSDPQRNRDHYRRALQASSAITVSTPYLADRIREFVDCPVHVLRNALDPELWDPQTVVGWDTFTIAWVGAVRFRSPKDLNEVSGVIGPLLARNPSWRFVHIGAENPAQTVEVAAALGIRNPDQVESRPMCSIHNLPGAMKAVDVFLAPLERSSFNLCKSAVKSQEAAAAGAPFIASDMPEYRWFSDGRAGILCDSPRAWRHALERLADLEERRKLARVGRERVSEVSIQNTWRKWEATYERAMT